MGATSDKTLVEHNKVADIAGDGLALQWAEGGRHQIIFQNDGFSFRKPGHTQWVDQRVQIILLAIGKQKSPAADCKTGMTR